MKRSDFKKGKPKSAPALMDMVFPEPGNPNFSRPRPFNKRGGSNDGNSSCLRPSYMQNSSDRSQHGYQRNSDDRNPTNFQRDIGPNNSLLPPPNLFPVGFPNSNIPNANSAEPFDRRLSSDGNMNQCSPNFMQNAPQRNMPPFFPNMNDPNPQQSFERMSPSDGNPMQGPPPNYMPNIPQRFPSTSMPPPFFQNANNSTCPLPPFSGPPPMSGGAGPPPMSGGAGLLPTPRMPAITSVPPPSAPPSMPSYPYRGNKDSMSPQPFREMPYEAKVTQPPPSIMSAAMPVPPSDVAKPPSDVAKPPIVIPTAISGPVTDVAKIPKPSSSIPFNEAVADESSYKANSNAENSISDKSALISAVIKDLSIIEIPVSQKVLSLITKPAAAVPDLPEIDQITVPEVSKSVLPEIVDLSPETDSPKVKEESTVIPKALAKTASPVQPEIPIRSRVKLPTLGKDAARKRLRAFTSNLLAKERKAKADQSETVITKEEPVVKKKMVQKKSVIGQIMEEETRLKMVLEMHNCNSDSAMVHLQNLIDDPVAISIFEKKARDLKARIDADTLVKPKDLSPPKQSGASSSRSIRRKHRSTRDPSTEKRKRKVVPKSWHQLKRLNISIVSHKCGEESDSRASPMKAESRRSDDAHARFSPLDDKIWVGLAMHKNLVPLRVNRSVGHSKKEYGGSMVKTTVTKPHITFCKNSGTVSRHYMTRSEARYRNKSSKDIWPLMKNVWNSKPSSRQSNHPGNNSGWYVRDWNAIDHEEQTATADNITLSAESALSELSKKYNNDSDASGNEETSLPSFDNREADSEMSDGVEPEIANSVELANGSDNVVSDISPKSDSKLNAEPEPFDDEPMDTDSHAVNSILSEIPHEKSDTEEVRTDLKEKSGLPSPTNQSPSPKRPPLSPIISNQSPERVASPVLHLPPSASGMDSVLGRKVSEMTLKEVKSLLCSDSVNRRERKMLKQLKKVLQKVKKEKKKLKKDRKRMRREKRKQKKVDKKLSLDAKQPKELENEPVVTVAAKADPIEPISSPKDVQMVANEDLYNPEDPQLSDDKDSPEVVSSFANERYSPTSSPFYFSNDSGQPSPHEPLSYDCDAPLNEHSSVATIVPTKDTDEQMLPFIDTKIIETSPVHSTPSSGISEDRIDLSSIPTPSLLPVPHLDTARVMVDTPMPVPPPKLAVPMPVPPVDLQLIQSIASNVRKEVIQQSAGEPSPEKRVVDPSVKPVAFRLSLGKAPTGKLVKPSVPSLFQEDMEDRARESGALLRPLRPDAVKPVKCAPQIDDIEASVNSSPPESGKMTAITAIVVNQEPYSPSQCDPDSDPSKAISSGANAPEEQLQPLSDIRETIPVIGNASETKRSASPYREKRPRSNSSPQRRHRDRSPYRRSRDGYSRSRRSPPRHRRSRSRSPRRFRYKDERRSSKGSLERHSRSPSPKRSHYEPTRESERSSPKPSLNSVNKIPTTTGEQISTIKGNKIECVSNMGEPRPPFDISMSDVGVPTQNFDYDVDSNYPRVMDIGSTDDLGSPKRPSLVDRLRDEHGLQMEDSPSAFEPGDKYFDSESPQVQHTSYDDNQGESVAGSARVIRVGNVLQILPQDLPVSVEDSVSNLPVELPKSVQSMKTKTTTTTVPPKREVTNYSVPLSPSFSPPPDGRISPLPPPSPKPKEIVAPAAVAPATAQIAAALAPPTAAPVTPPIAAPMAPFVGGPIPGLSSEALISAAAAASAASNVPFAQLISVLQEQNLLPKSVPVQQEVAPAAPVQEPSPESQLPDVDKNKKDIEALKKENRERKLRKRQDKERRRNERRRQKEEELSRQVALQRADEDNDEALIKEAISEVPELDGPIPDSYLNDDDEIGPVTAPHALLPLPPPDKGILIIPSYKETVYQQRKSVCFADGITPGEGTSASGEDTVVETPVRKVKRKMKKDRPAKKAWTREIKSYDRLGDGISSPPPPPDEPPPPDAINLYPGWTHCTYTGPESVVIYTQKLLDSTTDQMRDSIGLNLKDSVLGHSYLTAVERNSDYQRSKENSVLIPPGMLVHSDGLMNVSS